MKSKYLSFLFAGILLASSCQNGKTNQTTSEQGEIDSTVFYTNFDNKDVLQYVIGNDKVKVSVTNFGARIVSLIVNDKAGNPVDVLLGYDTADEFIKNTDNFYGAVVGRFGNRIGNATFTLNGQKYELEKNDGDNSLHGGTNGVYNKVWDVKSHSGESITLEYLSPDGEAGYPGNVTMQVTYKVNANGGLEIDYSGVTDKETILNLTSHGYFNLNGEGDTTILDHELWIDANKITEVNKSLIPTGKSINILGTAFDFTKPKLIGKDINRSTDQLKYGQGYDHNFELNKKDGFAEVASLYAPNTGIEMKILTTEPGLQFYSGNFMSDEDPKGKGGKAYPFRAALCLETQHFPDAPNHDNFPSTTLRPGEKYTSKTEYRFSTR
ncbi:aldose epimerase family protein [Sphingobacterium bovisgrunnientis]|jgi:aldose 1-epimerase|uniref:aldose epimerase family protein n=1 Tax=Sphingobacterium bovisgrunnientis TaxID=1874697 RepID=UPI0013579B42|nr:aldose epimerase family protein [Sphingobacterium bovisgrunnientis]